eukprot:CAMPEP_0198284804 /NCGR_PEP_ID=MMETSP1449-20131203/4227_1 /TAXON_ID=420275 /ORGANISM="Attheya septentrionalis, Strain CCMP2084" /LENGTH=43 /DNA_ID= /DNA_START= /DNA_END= /DNA_ORIENTATION=
MWSNERIIQNSAVRQQQLKQASTLTNHEDAQGVSVALRNAGGR